MHKYANAVQHHKSFLFAYETHQQRHKTPLLAASLMGHVDIVKDLLKAKANVQLTTTGKVHTQVDCKFMYISASTLIFWLESSTAT